MIKLNLINVCSLSLYKTWTDLLWRRPAALNYPYLSHSAVRPAVASVVAPAVAPVAVSPAVAPVPVAPAHKLAPIAGETRVEYHPYNKTVVEYETQYVTQ